MCTAKRVLTIVIALSVFCSQLLHFFLDPFLPSRKASFAATPSQIFSASQFPLPIYRPQLCRNSPLQSVSQRYPEPVSTTKPESLWTLSFMSLCNIILAWCPNIETPLPFYISFTFEPTSYLNPSFICDVSRRSLALGYGRFGTDNRSRFERGRLAREVGYQLPTYTARRLR